jgi:hypothetical protein
MAKAQGKKKAATAARRATSKAASRVKSAAKAVTRKVKAAPAKPAKKVVKAVKAVKSVAKSAAKSAARPVARAVAKKPPKPARRAAAAPPPPAKRGPALTIKPAAVAPPAAKAPVAPKVPAAPQPEKKTRARRSRPRVHSNGTPVAAWLPQDREKPRPSSFIPAPPRAEAPSLIAAPPASSDRLIRPEDVTEFVTRTVPVRVDVEQGGGRFYIAVNPEEVTLRAGEGIEWDFRYLGGADVVADELLVEFEKPSPFSHAVYKSRKPGAARPHRQLSGAAHQNAAGKRVQYTIKAMTPFKTELASAKLWVNIA